jgi:hypothetical protein
MLKRDNSRRVASCSIQEVLSAQAATKSSKQTFGLGNSVIGVA